MKNVLLTLSFMGLVSVSTSAFATESLPVLTSEHKQELTTTICNLIAMTILREMGLMVSDWDQWANELAHNIPQLKHDLIDLYAKPHEGLHDHEHAQEALTAFCSKWGLDAITIADFHKTVCWQTPEQSAATRETLTRTQRFSLYATLYLNLMEEPKTEKLVHLRKGDISDADFALILDNALLVNLAEIVQEMTVEELRTENMMKQLAFVLNYAPLNNEPSIQERKMQIIEIIKNKGLAV